MAKNKDIKIIRRIRRIEFWYKGEFYIYEFRSENNAEYPFIWKDGTKIYGPLINNSTEEGIEVYNAIFNETVDQKF